MHLILSLMAHKHDEREAARWEVVEEEGEGEGLAPEVVDARRLAAWTEVRITKAESSALRSL